MVNMKAILYMLLFCACLPLGDALVRGLSEQGMSVFQIIWVRSVVIVSLLLPVLLKRGALKIPRPLWGLYALRSLFFFLAVASWLSVLKHVPLPQIYAVGFTAPIMASLISVPVLKETLTRRKLLGLIGGFCGTLIVIRPGVGVLNPYLLVPLFCALNWAGALVLSKKLSTTESSVKLTCYLSMSFIVFTSVATVSNWVMPQGMEWGILLVLGGLVLLSHLALLKAYQLADLTVLAPVEFSSLIFATMFGWLFFKEGVDLWTVSGALIIFASALSATLRPRPKPNVDALEWIPD